MKTSSSALLALLADHAVAQYFVMYGTDTAVQRVDPILAPGTISSHVHEFFGANNVNPSSTYESLQSANCSSIGRAGGIPIVEDKSAYWRPALYVKSNSNDSLLRVPNDGHQTYYENSGTGTMADPFEFPEGFRMLAGNPMLRSAQEHTPTNSDNITQWICHAPTWNQGAGGGFPTDVTSCSDYPFFNGAIHFPHCWNGDDFDLANPTAHMSYPTGDIQNGDCPSTHPTRLPHIFMETNFNLDALEGQFEENTFALAHGDGSGFGWHADFLNGWKSGVLHNLLSGDNACYNHDIGACGGNFVTFDTGSQVADCIAPVTYVEDVNGPIPALPGCNPITTEPVAPPLKTCKIGTCDPNSDDLIPGSSSSNSSSGSSESASASAGPSGYSSAAPSAASSTASSAASSVAASAASSAASVASSDTAAPYPTPSPPIAEGSTLVPASSATANKEKTTAAAGEGASTTAAPSSYGSSSSEDGGDGVDEVIVTVWETVTVTVDDPPTATAHKRRMDLGQLVGRSHGHRRHDF